MKNILNSFFYYLKFLLLLGAFSLSLYIMIGMCYGVNRSIISVIFLFLPFILLLLLFMFNKIMKHDIVNKNIFYNLTCSLAFSVIIFVALRAIFDKGMVLNYVMGYNINFNYFNDFLLFMQVLLYGLIAGNCLFILSDK